MIKQLLNSVITKYHDLSVSRRSIICKYIDLLATDKSRYFAQPCSIIVKWRTISLEHFLKQPVFLKHISETKTSPRFPLVLSEHADDV